MVSANTELRDRALEHLHALQRFKNGQVKSILGMLNRDAYEPLVDELQRRLSRITAEGFDRGVESTKRLRDLVAALEDILESGMSKAETKLTKALQDFAPVEAKAAIGQVHRLDVGLELVLPSPETLRAIVTSRPFAGELLKEHFEALTRSSQRILRRELNFGLVAGEGFDDIARRIHGAGGMLEHSRRQVRSVVGAAVQHVGNAARQATYRENEDIIAGEQFVATLDSRTCPQCQALDGQEFPIGEGPMPPLHLGPCRCSRVPVLKSWRDLGIDADDMPEGTRASMDGEVAEGTTYPDWLERQSEAVQDEALGPERAALWRSGEVAIDKFVDDFGRTIPLAELARIYGLD